MLVREVWGRKRTSGVHARDARPSARGWGTRCKTSIIVNTRRGRERTSEDRRLPKRGRIDLVGRAR